MMLGNTQRRGAATERTHQTGRAFSPNSTSDNAQHYRNHRHKYYCDSSDSDNRRSSSPRRNDLRSEHYRERRSPSADRDRARTERYRSQHRPYSRESTYSNEKERSHYREIRNHSSESDRTYYREPYRSYTPDSARSTEPYSLRYRCNLRKRDHTKYYNRKTFDVSKKVHPKYIDFDSYRLNNGKLFCPKCCDFFHSYGECKNFSCDDKHTIPRICPDDIKANVQKQYDGFVEQMVWRKGNSFWNSQQGKRLNEYKKGGPYGHEYIPPVFYTITESTFYADRVNASVARCSRILTEQRQNLGTAKLFQPHTPYINNCVNDVTTSTVPNCSIDSETNITPQTKARMQLLEKLSHINADSTSTLCAPTQCRQDNEATAQSSQTLASVAVRHTDPEIPSTLSPRPAKRELTVDGLNSTLEYISNSPFYQMMFSNPHRLNIPTATLNFADTPKPSPRRRKNAENFRIP
ncbi:uncharacterized protein LOC129593492 [Paramacrobiotus metropolitanus]|uniref:uncharacterized protein LOC129593492 n=1 Tax=Paramacrobiotus metropolitanus TaxID=2943436 RepID=UPI002445AB0C|nr:uncharacterized protein LOC129593492 [Paramacrobiotus metropolitanus]